MQEFDSFTDAYRHWIERVYVHHDFVSRPRGMEVKECLAASFVIKNPRDRLPWLRERKFNVAYYVAETLFYLLGRNDLEWIAEYSPFWKNVSDDGLTVNSAYGARIFGKDENMRSQWDYVIEELTRDPESRRAVIHIRLPSDSNHTSKDVPCTVSLSYTVRDNSLCAFTNMRSTDIIFGLGNDFPAFSTLQELMALQLGRDLGKHYFTTNSLHVYSRHYEMCEKILNDKLPESDPMPQMISLPPLSILAAIEQAVRELGSKTNNISDLLERIRALDPYWRDWMLVLASRRCKKGSECLSNDCIRQINWDGFKRLLT